MAFFIGETKGYSEVRWNEHGCLKKSSEVGDHLLVNPDHNTTWQIRAKASAQTFKRKILEAFYISKLKPTLNSQEDIKITHLFRHGIRWIPEGEILCVDNIFHCKFLKWF